MNDATARALRLKKEAVKKVAALQSKIKNFGAGQKELDWCQVGTMEKINIELSELCSFLGIE